jgi:hypothetical protein
LSFSFARLTFFKVFFTGDYKLQVMTNTPAPATAAATTAMAAPAGTATTGR